MARPIPLVPPVTIAFRPFSIRSMNGSPWMNRWNNSSKLRASSYPSYMKRISASGGWIASDELTLAFLSRKQAPRFG